MPLLQGHPQRAGCLQGLLRQRRPPLGIALAVARQQHLGVAALGADKKAADVRPGARSPHARFRAGRNPAASRAYVQPTSLGRTAPISTK